MTRTPLGSRLTKTFLLSCHQNSFLYTWVAGAVVWTERVGVHLAVWWWYLETRWWMGDLESKMETRLNSSLSSKSYSGVVARTTDLVALMSSLSKMRTGTSERSAAEFWPILMECGQGQEQEQGAKDKARSKRKGKKKPEEWGASQGCEATAENVTTFANCWQGKEKQVNRVRNKAGTVSLSSCRHKKSWDSSSPGVMKTQKRAGWVWSLVS